MFDDPATCFYPGPHTSDGRILLRKYITIPHRSPLTVVTSSDWLASEGFCFTEWRRSTDWTMTSYKRVFTIKNPHGPGGVFFAWQSNDHGLQQLSTRQHKLFRDPQSSKCEEENIWRQSPSSELEICFWVFSLDLYRDMSVPQINSSDLHTINLSFSLS